MNFKKIINFFDSAGKMISLTGLGITLILITVIKVFDVKVSDYLKEIPFLQYFINMDLIESFENVDEDDVFYVELQNNIEDFMKDSGNIKNITVKQISENQKIFKIIMKDGVERLITITKDGDVFNFNMEIIARLLLQKNGSGTFIQDMDNGSFKRMIEDEDYCLRCSIGGGGGIGGSDPSEQSITLIDGEGSDDYSMPTEATVSVDSDYQVAGGGGGGGSSSIVETGDSIHENTTGDDYISQPIDDAFGYGDSTVY